MYQTTYGYQTRPIAAYSANGEPQFRHIEDEFVIVNPDQLKYTVDRGRPGFWPKYRT